jgi:hypothetical protein
VLHIKEYARLDVMGPFQRYQLFDNLAEAQPTGRHSYTTTLAVLYRDGVQFYAFKVAHSPPFNPDAFVVRRGSQ